MSRAPGGSHGILKAKDNEKDPQIMRSPVSKKFVFWPSGGGDRASRAPPRDPPLRWSYLPRVSCSFSGSASGPREKETAYSGS